MFVPESYLAIVKSALDEQGTLLLLEPTEPDGIEIAKEYKRKLYEMGMPVISFGANDLQKNGCRA